MALFIRFHTYDIQRIANLAFYCQSRFCNTRTFSSYTTPFLSRVKASFYFASHLNVTAFSGSSSRIDSIIETATPFLSYSTDEAMAFLHMSRARTKKNRKAQYQVLSLFMLSIAFLIWLVTLTPTTTMSSTAPHFLALSAQICAVKLTTSCESARLNVAAIFTDIYRTKKWGTSSSSHTRSGTGSTIQGAFETIVSLEPKLVELNISSIADVPSGDCGWQFSLPSINAAQAYFGGDITPHVAEENARRFHSHKNKVFAFWDLVECALPRWSTTCDPAPRTFDLIILRDVIQHMTIESAMKAVKSVILDSGATYLATTSYSTERCQDQRGIAITTDGDFYRNNLHCPPWDLPEPFFKFESHLQFPDAEAGDWMEFYRIADLASVVLSWPTVPRMVSQ